MAFDNLGRPTRLLGIDLDTTSRKQNELALRQARERAQRYLDIAGVIIVVLDADHRVTLLNRKGCEILGIGERTLYRKLQEWKKEASPRPTGAN